RCQGNGGITTEAEITKAQAKSLETKLNEAQDDVEFEMYIGLKQIEPCIEDALEEMAEAGITGAVSIVLAPRYSTFSVKAYNSRAHETADKHGIALTSFDDCFVDPMLIDY